MHFVTCMCVSVDVTYVWTVPNPCVYARIEEGVLVKLIIKMKLTV